MQTAIRFLTIAVLSLCSGLALAAKLDGTVGVSGMVTSPAPFTAAKVYAWNRDKNILYMVYTNKGQYNAINLFPGAYEIWAQKDALASEHRMLRIEAGQTVKIDHQLGEAPDFRRMPSW